MGGDLDGIQAELREVNHVLERAESWQNIMNDVYALLIRSASRVEEELRQCRKELRLLRQDNARLLQDMKVLRQDLMLEADDDLGSES